MKVTNFSPRGFFKLSDFAYSSLFGKNVWGAISAIDPLFSIKRGWGFIDNSR